MMIAKTHSNNGRLVLAICDSDIIGNTYEEGEKILDLTSSFYKGKEASEEVVERLIKQAYIINAVGKESVQTLRKLKIIEEDKLIAIANIPYMQIVNTNMEG